MAAAVVTGGFPSRRARGPRGARLRRFLRRFGRDRAAVAGTAIIGTVVLSSLLAPLFGLPAPNASVDTMRMAPPGTLFLLGADEQGRDILSRLVWGGRISLLVGTAPTVIAALVGLLIGLPAAYAGGMLDLVAMRVMDILFAFPMVLLAVAVAGVLGPGIINQVVAIAVVLIPYTTRVVRNVVVAERQREYVEAARAQGANARRIIGRHLLPNVLGPLIVYSSSMLGLMIVAGSGLSFLGLGVQPPTPDWGTMVASGKNVLQVAPHVAAIPGLVIMTVAVAFNYIGDGFRDAMMVR
ncbi:MAG TPA: ABC transporter permease [bacterium]|nr:ABC transporter permease [bacterium]